VKVVTRAQWGARAPRSRTGLSGSNGLVAHHNGPRLHLTADCDNGRRCKAAVQATQRFHMDVRGWQDLAYNFLVCPSCGRIYEGRGWGNRSAANGTNTGNSWGHAVMVLIGEGEPLTTPAKKALTAVAAEHRRRYGRHQWRTHDQFKATACPGPGIRSWVKSGATVPPDPPPLPPDKPEDDEMTLKPGGNYGNTTRLFKRCLNNEADRNNRTDAERLAPNSDTYGPKMAERVKQAQRGWGLEPTGEIDGLTAAMLLRFE
jgi:hypothetical protein